LSAIRTATAAARYVHMRVVHSTNDPKLLRGRAFRAGRVGLECCPWVTPREETGAIARLGQTDPMFRRQPCSICHRATLHEVKQVKSGAGEVLADPAKCTEHREFTNGQIDVRDPRTGEWVTVRPPRS
jgi:hypothetical protein